METVLQRSATMASARPQTAGRPVGPAPCLHAQFRGVPLPIAKNVARVGRKAAVVKAQAVAVAPAPVKLIEGVVGKAINAIRFLSIDGVNKANSGHPGLPMGCAPMAYILFNEAMTFNPKDPAWFNRDRFVLSAGHGSMLQYSLLHLTGYDSVTVRISSNKIAEQGFAAGQV